MTRFSIPQAAFSGYRLLVARPGTALVWFVFQLVVVLFTAFVTVSLAGPQLTQLKEIQASGAVDPATVMALNGQMLPYTIFKMLFPLLTGSIACAAVARAVLRPAQGGLGYLRFGGDELRLLVVYVVLTIIMAVPYVIATVVGMGVLMGVGGREAAMALSQGAFGALPGKAAGFAILAMLPFLALVVFLGIKLSLAPVQTVAERGIRLFESWRLTKGQFWRIFAAFLLSAAPLAVVGVLVLFAARAMNAGANFNQAMQGDVSSMAAAFSGAMIGLHVIAAVLQTLVMAGPTAAAATIYAALVQGTEAEVFGDADEDDDDDED